MLILRVLPEGRIYSAVALMFPFLQGPSICANSGANPLNQLFEAHTLYSLPLSDGCSYEFSHASHVLYSPGFAIISSEWCAFELCNPPSRARNFYVPIIHVLCLGAFLNATLLQTDFIPHFCRITLGSNFSHAYHTVTLVSV